MSSTPAIAKALHVNSSLSLTVLNLYDNAIGGEAEGARGRKVRWQRLRKDAGGRASRQRLGGNKIGDKGAKAIAGALRVNGSLKPEVEKSYLRVMLRVLLNTLLE